ncbi:MAG: hypothetical protein R3C03_20850 [Pirellulaceae bacterium]
MRYDSPESLQAAAGIAPADHPKWQVSFGHSPLGFNDVHDADLSRVRGAFDPKMSVGQGVLRIPIGQRKISKYCQTLLAYKYSGSSIDAG